MVVLDNFQFPALKYTNPNLLILNFIAKLDRFITEMRTIIKPQRSPRPPRDVQTKE